MSLKGSKTEDNLKEAFAALEQRDWTRVVEALTECRDGYPRQSEETS